MMSELEATENEVELELNSSRCLPLKHLQRKTIQFLGQYYR